jgi:hypothetical protein
MVNKEEYKRLAENRHKNPESFITYLCKIAKLKNPTLTKQRKNPLFIKHCIDLYHKQEGKCAISGVKMTYTHQKKSPTQISIDRIDNSRGYEAGNVRLTCLWINDAIKDTGLRVMLFFMRNTLNREHELEELIKTDPQDRLIK